MDWLAWTCLSQSSSNYEPGKLPVSRLVGSKIVQCTDVLRISLPPSPLSISPLSSLSFSLSFTVRIGAPSSSQLILWMKSEIVSEVWQNYAKPQFPRLQIMLVSVWGQCRERNIWQWHKIPSKTVKNAQVSEWGKMVVRARAFGNEGVDTDSPEAKYSGRHKEQFSLWQKGWRELGLLGGATCRILKGRGSNLTYLFIPALISIIWLIVCLLTVRSPSLSLEERFSQKNLRVSWEIWNTCKVRTGKSTWLIWWSFIGVFRCQNFWRWHTSRWNCPSWTHRDSRGGNCSRSHCYAIFGCKSPWSYRVSSFIISWSY